MINAYTWPTPNGHKVHIMLYECDLEHEIVPIDILNGDQFSPEFLSISPNNRIPAIVDSDGPDGKEISIFETAAILCYLANKSGKFLLCGKSTKSRFFKNSPKIMIVTENLSVDTSTAGHRRTPGTAPDLCY